MLLLRPPLLPRPQPSEPPSSVMPPLVVTPPRGRLVGLQRPSTPLSLSMPSPVPSLSQVSLAARAC